MTSKIEAIFFDVGGVLVAPALNSLSEQLTKKGITFSKQRLRELLLDERVLTGPVGTLDLLLHTEFQDIQFESSDILTLFSSAQSYDPSFSVARALNSADFTVGIISDQIAETALMLRQQYFLEDLFNPIFFSPEVKLTKRTPAIFEMAQKMTNYSPSELLMIDDHNSILTNARAAGWQSLLYTYPADLREQLHSYGVL